MTDSVQPITTHNNQINGIKPKSVHTVSINTLLHRCSLLIQSSTQLQHALQQRQATHTQLHTLLQQRNTVLNEYDKKQSYINTIKQTEQFINEQRQLLSDRNEAINIVNNELLASRKHTLHTNLTYLNDTLKPQLHSTIQDITNNQQHLNDLRHQLKLQQQNKCDILSHIYTIQPSKLLLNNIVHTNGIYSIRQYKLPIHKLHTFQGKHVDTALQYTAHMTILLSQYLNVPLRYHIILCGSTTNIVDSNNDKQISLPLHISTTNDLLQFDAACNLLLKNIQHICAVYFGIGHQLQQSMTTDQSMLHCLYVLLRHILAT